MKKYEKLNKFESYDKEAAEELAEVLMEMQTLNSRLEYLKELVDENKELHAFIWGVADGKMIPMHKIEDEHLKNIMTHLLNTGRKISKPIQAEARKRGFEVPTKGTIAFALGSGDAFGHNDDNIPF